ncbi:MAG: hypothetical protein AAFQ99_09990 [Pseudomonadota bacterium]
MKLNTLKGLAAVAALGLAGPAMANVVSLTPLTQTADLDTGTKFFQEVDTQLKIELGAGVEIRRLRQRGERYHVSHGRLSGQTERGNRGEPFQGVQFH